MLAGGRQALRGCWALQWHVCRHMFCFCSAAAALPVKWHENALSIFNNSKPLEPGARLLCPSLCWHTEPAQPTGISGETSQPEELNVVHSTLVLQFFQKCKAAKKASVLQLDTLAGNGCRQWEAEPKCQHQNCPVVVHSLGFCSSLTCQPFTLRFCYNKTLGGMIASCCLQFWVILSQWFRVKCMV